MQPKALLDDSVYVRHLRHYTIYSTTSSLQAVQVKQAIHSQPSQHRMRCRSAELIRHEPAYHTAQHSTAQQSPAQHSTAGHSSGEEEPAQQSAAGRQAQALKSTAQHSTIHVVSQACFPHLSAPARAALSSWLALASCRPARPGWL